MSLAGGARPERPRGFTPHPIRDVRQETEDTISLGFAPAPFIPGQYLTLRATIDGDDTRRSYSICSGLDDDELRIAIKRVPGGRFSAWAHAALQPGHAIDLLPPDGRFVHSPDPAARATYLAVAAGSGITPVLSILRSTLAREAGSRFILLYGSRATGSILFREALEDLKDRYLARLSVVHVLSREQQDIPALNGRLDGARTLELLAGLADPAALDAAFLCGPGGLVESVTAALAGVGLTEARIHSERFTAAGAPVPSRPPPPATAPAHATATIVADGIRTEVPLADGETVLEGALRAGLDLPFSCRGGMCSTCRARVTEGAVRMDVNYALEPWETEAGFVLTCQSHPTTPHVTIDYDHL